MSLPVSKNPILHTAIINSWTRALLALENLIKGRGQRIQSGEVLLGLSSRHLYPDISVVNDESHHIKQSDPLISPGGIITIGLHNKPDEADNGIYWSLPLAHMRYYGDPTVATRHTGLRESQVTSDQFIFVALGSVLSSWRLLDQDLETPLQVINMLSESVVNTLSKRSTKSRSQIMLIKWMSMISRLIQAYGKEQGAEKQQLDRLISFGRRRCPDLIAVHRLHPSPFFGFTNFEVLLSTFRPEKVQQKIAFLRKWSRATFSSHDIREAIIEYSEHQHSNIKYTYLAPQHAITRKRPRDGNFTIPTARDFHWVAGPPKYHLPVNQRNDSYVMIPPGPGGKPAPFGFLCGHPGSAAIYLPAHREKKSKSKSSKPLPKHNHLGVKDIFYCLKTGVLEVAQLANRLCLESYRHEFSEYLESFEALFVAHQIYSSLPGAKVNLNVTSKQLQLTWWKSLQEKRCPDGTVPLPEVFSCITLFETGFLELDPSKLTDAVAICSDNSIFVASRLLLDPIAEVPTIPVKRITGNIGKPGFSILIPPAEPKILQIGCRSWKVVAHENFDGKFQDSFAATSLHLSLTGYEFPIDVGVHGARDHGAFFVEAAISLHDRGKWMADLDVIKAQSSWQSASEQSVCQHTEDQRADTTIAKPLVSVDSWIEFLDLPLSDCIVRARDNAMARLAAASLAVQKSYDFRLISPSDCWICLFAEPGEEYPSPPCVYSARESDSDQGSLPESGDWLYMTEEEESDLGSPLAPLFAGVGDLHASMSPPCMTRQTNRVLIY